MLHVRRFRTDRIADGKAVTHAGVVSGKAYETTEKWV